MKLKAKSAAFLFVSLLTLALLANPVQAKLDAKTWKSLNKQLKVAYAQKKYDTIASLFDEIATDNTKRAYDTIKKYTLAVNDAGVYVAARDSLATITEKKAMARFLKDLEKSKSPKLKVLLIDATASRDDDESIKLVNATLNDRRDEVVRAALETITKRRHKSSIDALIELFAKYEEKKASGLNVINTQKALIALTGKNLDTAEDYKYWWKDNKGSFSTEDRPTTGEDIKDASLSSVERGKKPKFFGSEITSRRIVFVIDTSCSMREKDPLPPGKEGAENPDDGREVTGTGGKKKKKKDDKKDEEAAPVSDSRVRLKRAQFQLSYVLSKLPKDAQFTIIAYNGDTSQFPTYKKSINKQPTNKWLNVWKPNLQSITGSNVKSAQDFVNKFKENGWTFTFNALRAAMEVPGVDNIILLSDGGPNDPIEGAKQKGGPKGKVDWDRISQNDIVDRITKLNAYHKIKIDTFGFEPIDQNGRPMVSGYVQFLTNLAEANKGKFTAIR